MAVVALLILGAGCMDLCGTTALAETSSPAGEQVAVLFLHSCGATTGYSIHVAILAVGEHIPEGTDGISSESVFAGYITPVPEDSTSQSMDIRRMVRVAWRSDRELEVHYERGLTVSRQQRERRGVAVTLVPDG
jgi:hypothetical protein